MPIDKARLPSKYRDCFSDKPGEEGTVMAEPKFIERIDVLRHAVCEAMRYVNADPFEGWVALTVLCRQIEAEKGYDPSGINVQTEDMIEAKRRAN